MNDLDTAREAQQRLLDYLNTAYEKGTGLKPGQARSNQLVIDAFVELLPQDIISQIEEFLTARGYIFDRIKEQNGRRHLFNQPSVLLAYFLAHTMPAQTRENWPIESGDLGKVFSDLGIGFSA